MLDIFKQYATDETLENNGTWKEIGSGASILVARNGNKAYAKLLAKLYEQNRAVLEKEDDAANERSQQIMLEVLAETILLGWKGIGAKGVETPYSKEEAKKFLAVKDFRAIVIRESERLENFLLKEEVTQGEA